MEIIIRTGSQANVFVPRMRQVLRLHGEMFTTAAVDHGSSNLILCLLKAIDETAVNTSEMENLQNHSFHSPQCMMVCSHQDAQSMTSSFLPSPLLKLTYHPYIISQNSQHRKPLQRLNGSDKGFDLSKYFLRVF